MGIPRAPAGVVASRARRVLGALGALTLLLLPDLGCGQVLRLDDYAVAEPGAGGSAGDWPILPALPAEARRADCEACVAARGQDGCGDRRAACLESERCRDMLQCTRNCDNPRCLADCADQLPQSGVFQAFFTCAFTAWVEWAPGLSACGSRCGPSWDCVGKFDWEPHLARAVRADVLVVRCRGTINGQIGGPASTFGGVQVAACVDDLGNDGCGSWEGLDPYGKASLDLSNFAAIATRSVDQHDRLYTRPIVRSTGKDARMVLPASDTVSLVESIGSRQNPKLGMVAVEQVDCLGTVEKTQIRVTTPAAVSDAGFIADTPPCDFDASASCGDASGPSAFFANVSPAQDVLVTSSLSDGPQVSVKTVLVASGWSTSVILYPMSMKEAGH